jgi:hypothetical protein
MFNRLFLPAAGAFLLAALGSPANAQNGKQSSAPEYFSGKCSVNLQNDAYAGCNAAMVPAGKRLIVEHASAFCQISSGNNMIAPPEIYQVRLERGQTMGAIQVSLRKQSVGLDAGSLAATWSGDVAGRFTVAPGSGLNLIALRYPGTSGNAGCFLTVDGYLEAAAQ